MGELRFRHGVIDGPGSLEYLVPQWPPAPLGECADGGQEAEHQEELRHEPTPGGARGLEPLRTHRTHSLRGKDRSGGGNKLTVGVLQAGAVGLRGHPDAQPTATAYGGRAYDCGTRQPSALLSGAHILGPRCGGLDRGPGQTRTPAAEPRPLPQPRLPPKDRGHGRKRHAPLPPVERLLDLVGPRKARGPEKKAGRNVKTSRVALSLIRRHTPRCLRD